MSDHNQEAERAAFEAWAQESAIRTDLGAWEAWQAGRRAPAVGEDGLPHLPEPVAAFAPNGRAVKWDANYAKNPWLKDGYQPLYTAEQVRQAQRDAVAADRSAREGTVMIYGTPDDNLPRWIDNEKGKDPLMDDMIAYIIDLRAQLARQSQEDA